MAYQQLEELHFTFGGLKINENAQVIGTDWRPILDCLPAEKWWVDCFDNYPGGSGLVSGQVFGKIAGKSAANEA